MNSFLIYIEDYLNGEDIIVPHGYCTITEKYNFYHFMEDYLFNNWDEIISEKVYSVVDELPEFFSETEPYMNNSDKNNMDKKLKEYYNRIKKKLEE